MIRSKKLEETALWKYYRKKIPSDEKRSNWVKDIYEAAAKYMLDVRQTFQNYTLHDETHILNVLDAMQGLLGDQIERLTVGEMELLILSACLHDLGMVYTEEEKQRCYQDEQKCKKFLREHCPELMGCPAVEWPEDTRKWYLRTLHPFRLPEVLQNKEWRELFGRCPLEVVPKRCIIAVCQAHGEGAGELLNKRDLDHLAADDAEPLFCALLLRLGDLLDFDDTRAPKILYSYVVCNEKSRAEWDKHQASAGFRYPTSPSAEDLPYKARCTNPGIEHTVRDFLDWIDDELGNCIRLQKHCVAEWQKEFPFPRAVRRNEIESEGYMSGDFCLTMDQKQVLQLLTGENLYKNTDVFIRELLQNAMDATLLRGEMEPDFIPEESRIDLWEWSDKEGNVWFRIDDRGTGMTLGMLQRYFLKVGNSYYHSREMERDLRDHGKVKKYRGISQFGIGFLSCFLCGDYAEVSTLYFDDVKNRREEMVTESYQTIHHGLRLQVTGLQGYYTLKNQAKHHPADAGLPAPDGYGENVRGNIERDGYRATPGTTLVLRLDPGKLGALNLREVTEEYLCGARVPVYYNNERVGQTYEEFMAAAHEAAGEKIYEMTSDLKEEFDKCFPAVRGQYPKIAVSIIPLDMEENRILPELSGVFVKCEMRYDKVSQWKVKDQNYELVDIISTDENGILIALGGRNKNDFTMLNDSWSDLEKRFGSEKLAALAAEFAKHETCPRAEEIADVWKPFSEQVNLFVVWKEYLDKEQAKWMNFWRIKIELFQIVQRCLKYSRILCAYQGIAAGSLAEYFTLNDSNYALFLLGGECKPMVDISRSKVTGLSLTTLLAINGILSKYQMLRKGALHWNADQVEGWRKCTLEEWKKIKNSQVDRWLRENYPAFLVETMRLLQISCVDYKTGVFSIYNDDEDAVLHTYLMFCFQNEYQLIISYEEGQILSFCEKEECENDEMYDLFPPMMFCMAASDQSRRYICSENPYIRRGITADHPFIIWLLNNAAQLKQYYGRQFQQIVDCLRKKDAGYIIEECNRIREQLLAFPEHHGVDVRSFPQLSKDDFWPT